MSGAAPVVAQPAPPPSPAPPGKLQDRIDAAARALRENNPRFNGTSPEYVQGLAEFVSGLAEAAIAFRDALASKAGKR
jgi:hypothetical protein